MPTVKLTNKAILQAKNTSIINGLSVTLWDTELKGFGCVVSAKGKVSWLFYRRLGAGGRGAKQIRYVFGDFASMTLDAARDEAVRLTNDINNGIDPQRTKRKTRTQQHSAYHSGKLKDVFALYDQKVGKPGRYWNEVKRRFEVEIFPALGASTIIADITKQDIRVLIDAKEAKTKSGARLTFAALRPFFKWCVSRDLIPVSPCDGLTAPKLENGARDRVLTDDEIKLVWRGASTHGYPFGSFYKLLLLTAQRRDEVANMRWDELDLDKGEWIIPKERTKNHKEHLVHLSSWAVDILVSAKNKRKDGVPFVFTTTTTSGISGFSKAKRELDALMLAKLNERREQPQKLKPWRVHDLRRTAASGMAMLGVPPHIVERILNHISGSTGGLVGVYQRFEYVEERRKALNLWANHLNGLLLDEGKTKKDSTTNILPFGR